VECPEDVGGAWIQLFRDPERQKKMSNSARQLVEQNRGASQRALAEVAKYLGGAPR